MEKIEIFAGAAEEDGAQITMILDAERTVVSIFKFSTAVEQEDTSEAQLQTRQSLDHTISVFCQSLSTDDYDEQEALQDSAVEPTFDALYSLSAELTASSSNSPDRDGKIRTLHNLLFPKPS